MNVQTNKPDGLGWGPNYNVYRGIVIDNQDRQYPNSGRVQVFIPDIQGLNLVTLFKDKKVPSYRFPGENVGDLTEDVMIYLRGFCPWALPCLPIIGESGPGLYTKNGASVSEDPCSASTNSLTKPGYSVQDTGDGFATPSAYFNGKGNVHGLQYSSPDYSSQPKGVFAFPRVGAQLLIAFLTGDINKPVYIGSMPGVIEFQQMYAVGKGYGAPAGYESPAPIPPTARDINAKAPQPNINLESKPLSRVPTSNETTIVVDRTIENIIKQTAVVS
jgi:hypothetical protein